MICLELVHTENDLQLDGFTGQMGRHGVLPKNESMVKEEIVDFNSKSDSDSEKRNQWITIDD